MSKYFGIKKYGEAYFPGYSETKENDYKLQQQIIQTYGEIYSDSDDLQFDHSDLTSSSELANLNNNNNNNNNSNDNNDNIRSNNINMNNNNSTENKIEYEIDSGKKVNQGLSLSLPSFSVPTAPPLPTRFSKSSSDNFQLQGHNNNSGPELPPPPIFMPKQSQLPVAVTSYFAYSNLRTLPIPFDLPVGDDDSMFLSEDIIKFIENQKYIPKTDYDIRSFLTRSHEQLLFHNSNDLENNSNDLQFPSLQNDVTNIGETDTKPIGNLHNNNQISWVTPPFPTTGYSNSPLCDYSQNLRITNFDLSSSTEVDDDNNEDEDHSSEKDEIEKYSDSDREYHRGDDDDEEDDTEDEYNTLRQSTSSGSTTPLFGVCFGYQNASVNSQSNNIPQSPILQPPVVLSSPKIQTLPNIQPTIIPNIEQLKFTANQFTSNQFTESLLQNVAYRSENVMSTKQPIMKDQTKIKELKEKLQRSIEDIHDIELLKTSLISAILSSETSISFDNLFSILEANQTDERLICSENHRDWNKEFQELLEAVDSEETFTKLSQLAHDFVYVANTYAKIIISEHCLPDDQKTIKPIKVGGFAGGQKFICQNILFKFALDIQISESLYMYGGSSISDENAMKAAAHELKGLCYYYSTHMPGLHFPLLAYIDYNGYRMIAISVLPIRRGSLRYGSDDSGLTVHADNEDLNNKMLKTAEILNIQPHVAGVCKSTCLQLASCGDLEVHLGSDGKYYVLDFARTFPPEAPPLDKTQRDPRAVYFKLLRPELVRAYESPLNPDAFTTWSSLDPNYHTHNADVLKATIHLLYKIIPSFAEKLDVTGITGDDPGSSVVNQIHRLGINVRHLGQLRYHCKNTAVRNLLLLEMMVRIVKNYIRSQWRQTMKRVKGLAQEPFKSVAIETFNLILIRPQVDQTPPPAPNDLPPNPYLSYSQLYPSPVNTYTETPQHLSFVSIIKHKLTKKFWNGFTKNCGLTKSELDLNLFELIDLKLFFPRLTDLLGIRLTEQAKKHLNEDPRSFQFVDADIIEIYPIPRFLDIVDYAAAMSLAKVAERTHTREKLRLLEISEKEFEKAVQSTPSNYLTLHQWGEVLLQQAKFQTSPIERLELLSKACVKYHGSLEIYPNYIPSIIHFAESLITRAILSPSQKAEVFFKEAAALFQRAVAIDSKWTSLVHKYIFDLFRLKPSRTKYVCAIEMCKAIVQTLKADHFAIIMMSNLIQQYTQHFGYLKKYEEEYLMILREALKSSPDLFGLILPITNQMRIKAVECKQLYAYVGKLYEALTEVKQDEELFLEWGKCIWENSFSVSRSEYFAVLQVAAAKFQQAMEKNEGCLNSTIASAFRHKRMELIYLLELAAYTPLLYQKLQRYADQLVDDLNFKWCNISSTSVEIICRIVTGKDVKKLNLAHSSNAAELLGVFIQHSIPIKHLNLSYCENLTPSHVSDICEGLEMTLEYLDVGNCKLLSSEIFDPISKLQNLKYLSVKNCSITSNADLSVLSKNSHLESLILDNCTKLSDVHIKQLTSLTTLKYLSLAYCARVAATISEVVPTLRSLERIDVSNAYRDTTIILRSIVNSQLNVSYINVNNCKKLTDQGLEFAASLPMLTSLEFENCFRITENGLRKLSALPVAHRIIHLNIAHNVHFVEPEIRCLLSTLKNVQILNLSKCNITQDTLLALLQSHVNDHIDFLNQHTNSHYHHQHYHNHQQYGSSSSPPPLPSTLRSTSTATASTTSTTASSNSSNGGNGNEEDDEFIFNMIKKEGIPLQKLYLAHCQNLRSLDKLLPFVKHLRKLDLRQTSIYESSVSMLSSCCSHLTHLNLTGCSHITDEVAISSLPLIELKLGDCHNIGDKFIFKLINNCTTIEVLDLSNNTKITDNGMSSLYRLPYLTSLTVAGCIRIKNNAVISIVKYAKNLVHLDVSRTKLLNEELISTFINFGHSLHTLTIQDVPGISAFSAKSLARERCNMTVIYQRTSDVFTEISGHKQFLKGRLCDSSEFSPLRSKSTNSIREIVNRYK